MYHCLNKRKSRATKNYESPEQQEKLSWGYEGTQEKLPSTTNEGRRPTLEQKQINYIWNEYWRDTKHPGRR